MSESRVRIKDGCAWQSNAAGGTAVAARNGSTSTGGGGGGGGGGAAHDVTSSPSKKGGGGGETTAHGLRPITNLLAFVEKHGAVEVDAVTGVLEVPFATFETLCSSSSGGGGERSLLHVFMAAQASSA